MKNSLAGLILLVLICGTACAAVEPLWVRQAAGYSSDGRSIAVDSNGNVYVTGAFKGDVSFTSPTMDNPDRGEKGSDFFLASYAPDGKLRWVKQEGGTGHDSGFFVAAGRSGVYVTGLFCSPLNFGGHSLPANMSSALFLAKYSFAGEILWIRTADGAKNIVPTGLAVDADDNAHILGSFKDFADFGQIRLTKKMSKNLFLARYKTDGNLAWVKQITGGNSFITGPRGSGIAVAPDGSVVVTGHTSGDNRFDEIALKTAETRYGSKSLADSELFLARYDSTGKVLMVKSVASSADAEDLAVDDTGNIFLTGFFKGASSGKNAGKALFGNKTLAVTPDNDGRNSAGDVFVAKYNRNFALEWVCSAAGVGDNNGKGIVVDRQGNVSVTGIFSETIRFGTTSLTANGGKAWKSDLFLAEFAADGTLLAAGQAGGEDSDNVIGIAAAPDGTRYLTGWFKGPSPRFGKHSLIAGPRGLFFLVSYPPVGKGTGTGKH